MILEVVILNIKEGQSLAFENAFDTAKGIISSMKGFLSHELKKCIEEDDKYILLVNWETVEDHEIGFRQSDEYQDGKNYYIIFMSLFQRFNIMFS